MHSTVREEEFMGWTTGVRFLAGAVMGLCLFAIASRPALGPIQTPIFPWGKAAGVQS